jgi:hypothetical protein
VSRGPRTGWDVLVEDHSVGALDAIIADVAFVVGDVVEDERHGCGMEDDGRAVMSSVRRWNSCLQRPSARVSRSLSSGAGPILFGVSFLGRSRCYSNDWSIICPGRGELLCN